MRLGRFEIRRVNAAGPSPSDRGTLSGPVGGNFLGNIPLVPSLGQSRSATYRMIYLTNPWVWASVNMIARGLARNPLHVFELDAEGERSRVRSDVPQPQGTPSNGVRLDRALRMPDGRVSRMARLTSTMRDRLVYGSALWEMERLGAGLPESFHRIPWRQVTRVQVGDSGDVLFYEVSDRTGLGNRRVLQPDNVIHFGLGDDSENAAGVSPLEACRYTLALHEAIVRHLLAYFANSARPSGHIKVDKLTPEKFEEVRKMVEQVLISPENAGQVLITSGEWTETGQSPDHSQIVELVRLSREEIAAAYAVPPPVLGILEQAIKSNVKELREQYVRDSVGPWASSFEEDLQAQLLAPFSSWANLFVELQLAEQLRPDLEGRAMVYQRSANWLTPDEIRKRENLRPLKLKGFTDVPWVPGGYAPMGTAGRAPVAPPAAIPPEPPAAESVNGRRDHELSEVL